MPRRLAVLVGALICGVTLGSALAIGSEVTIFPAPDPGAVTVEPKGPGQDYKSNPAPPEVVAVPNKGSLTQAEKRTIWESMDPGDSPNVRVCVNNDGSGAIEFLTPAEPGAEAAPTPPGTPKATAKHINDKGPCQ
jgi:hypothetical protein